MKRSFLLLILISCVLCTEKEFKLDVKTQTQTSLDQALKSLVEELEHFATPRESAFYLQIKVDETTKCLLVMRDELSQYNNVIVGSTNEVNGSQNIIVGNYNSINGSDNFVFINNFKGDINGSLLIGKWRIELDKKEFIRINPSWAISFINDEDSKKYEKYLKRNDQWENNSVMSKATISLFKDVKEEIKNELQKGFVNMSSSPTSIFNNKVLLSSSSNIGVIPFFEDNTTSTPTTLILPTTSSVSSRNDSVDNSSKTMDKQFSSLVSTIQQQSNQSLSEKMTSFPVNDIKTGFVPSFGQNDAKIASVPTQNDIKVGLIPPTIQMPVIQNPLSNNILPNINLGMVLPPIPSNNVLAQNQLNLSLSTLKDNINLGSSSVIIGPTPNVTNVTIPEVQKVNTTNIEVKNININNSASSETKSNNSTSPEAKKVNDANCTNTEIKSTNAVSNSVVDTTKIEASQKISDNSPSNSAKSTNNLRTEDKPSSEPLNQLNVQLRTDIGPKYIRQNDLTTSILSQQPTVQPVLPLQQPNVLSSLLKQQQPIAQPPLVSIIQPSAQYPPSNFGINQGFNLLPNGFSLNSIFY